MNALKYFHRDSSFHLRGTRSQKNFSFWIFPAIVCNFFKNIGSGRADQNILSIRKSSCFHRRGRQRPIHGIVPVGAFDHISHSHFTLSFHISKNCVERHLLKFRISKRMKTKLLLGGTRVYGSEYFVNGIRGVPRISSTILSKGTNRSFHSVPPRVCPSYFL